MTILQIIQVILTLILVFLILIQAKGKGFGRSVASVSFTRRGLESLTFKLTFAVAALFVIVSIATLF